MKAIDKNRELQNRIERRTGKLISLANAGALRLAELLLHRWAELECGDSNEHRSWAIERDETTGKPYLVSYWHNGRTTRFAIPDREAGALRRVAIVCAENGLNFYQQGDPRGCALYVHSQPLSDRNYTDGVPCSVL